MFWVKQKNTERNNIQVSLIKSELSDLKKDIGSASKDDVGRIEKMNKIADIVELILYFNEEKINKDKDYKF